MTPARRTSTAVLVIVGAGPRATGLLERIAANAPELWEGKGNLAIHIVDPHRPGAGRVWRQEQFGLLRMNTMAEDITMFTDESSTIDGPVRHGPSLVEWAAQFSGANPYAELRDPEMLAELRSLHKADFPTRRALSAYLEWVFRVAVTNLPPNVTVEWHRTTATALNGPPDGEQEVHLAGRATPLVADIVVLAQGYVGSTPIVEHHEHAAFARRHGRFHLPPEFSADADLSALRPGEDVIMRGLGLAFIDLMSLLTEGRGGTFRTKDDGTLVYFPSGREPVMHVGSRRGVPYHAIPSYQLPDPRPPFPRYFGPDAVDEMIAENRLLDMRRDVWPLMAKEIGFGYYHALFHGHSERTALTWLDFVAAYDGLDWYSEEMVALVAESVPDPADRLDLEALDRPLDGLAFPTPDALQVHLRNHISRGVDRRKDQDFSADLGVYLALLSIVGQLPRLVAAGRLTARSVTEQVDGWWLGFFSFLTSGPPGFRLRQLVALSQAGIVRFLGAGVLIGTNEATRTFTATSPTVPGHTVHATALIEAYLPGQSLDRIQDPLLRDLHRAGALTEEVNVDATHTRRSGLIVVSPTDAHIVDPSVGGAHPRRIALGPATNGHAVAAFARPRTNASTFRQNDAVARKLLHALSLRFTNGDSSTER